MNEKPRRSPSIRMLRSRLIRDGNSEEDVDDILAELQTEFTAISEQEAAQRRPFFLERLARKLASRRLGEGAGAQDLDKLTKRYEQWLIPLSIAAPDLLPRAVEGIATIVASLAAEAEAPVATAALPPMERPVKKWYLPTDDPEATMHYADGGILFGAQPNTSVKAVEDGVIAEILTTQRPIRHIVFSYNLPFFWIELRHLNDVQTFYFGVGNPIVEKYVTVKAQQKMAILSHPGLFFQMAYEGNLKDPRGYSSFFPEIARIDPMPKGTVSILAEEGSHLSRTARGRHTGRQHERRQEVMGPEPAPLPALRHYEPPSKGRYGRRR